MPLLRREVEAEVSGNEINISRSRGPFPARTVILFTAEDYRSLIFAADLVSTRVRIKESDLLIRAEREVAGPAREVLARYRKDLEDYLKLHPDFGESLVPVSAGDEAPPIVREMTRAATLCGVGPMATVAGAFAYCVGRKLSAFSSEIIVENGGDIYLNSSKERVVAVFSGRGLSSDGRTIALRIRPEEMPLGVAASSGRLGRSLSWGIADAAVVLASDPVLADGAATALSNRIYREERSVLDRAGEFIRAIPGVHGYLVACGGLIAAGGRIELA